VTVEIGPKGRHVAVVAPDWPGLERGAKTEAAALQRLLAYVPRYAAVARLADMQAEFAAMTAIEVVERYPGTGSTDFWGISFAFSSLDQQPMSRRELDRELRLLRACWAFFDEVRSRVSSDLQRGIRGGGRDRDTIVRHVVGNEQHWAKKVGVALPHDPGLSEEELQLRRDSYCGAIQSFHAEAKMARTWPLTYLVRHTAYHALDHAWEMEDKDLNDPIRSDATSPLDAGTN
jgi:hypothetical protein